MERRGMRMNEYAKVTVVIETETRRMTYEMPRVASIDIEAEYSEPPFDLPPEGRLWAPEIEQMAFTFNPYKDEEGTIMTSKVEDLTVEDNGG